MERYSKNKIICQLDNEIIIKQIWFSFDISFWNLGFKKLEFNIELCEYCNILT